MTTPGQGFGPLKGPDLGLPAGTVSRVGSVSTVGIVLPPTTGRKVGDLHTLTPSQQEYVLEDVDGMLTWVSITTPGVMFAYDWAVLT